MSLNPQKIILPCLKNKIHYKYSPNLPNDGINDEVIPILLRSMVGSFQNPSDINMFLFSVVTFLTFFNAYASRIISLVLKTILRDKSVETISSEITELNKELSRISMCDEFPKYSRIRRKINRLRDEKKSLLEGNAAKVASLRYTALKITYGVTSVTLLILVYTYKGETIAELPPELLWPVPNIFNWFNGATGCISVPSWILISSTASKVLAKNY